MHFDEIFSLKMSTLGRFRQNIQSIKSTSFRQFLTQISKKKKKLGDGTIEFLIIKLIYYYFSREHVFLIMKIHFRINLRIKK